MNGSRTRRPRPRVTPSGVVYRAFDRDLRRHVAMKVMHRELSVDRDLAARFVEEAQATAQLQHPGIAPVHEIGLTEEGKLFFTMKLVRGRTLAAVVKETRAGDGGTARREPAEPLEACDLRGERFTQYRLLQVFVEICRALSYAHQRSVVHRDVKPSNIMIGRYGEALVMDWGIAKVLARVADRGEAAARPAVEVDGGCPATQTGAVVGTPAYMAPEQAEGDPERIGPLSDVYSLGATLYHILTGGAPFEGLSATEIIAKVHARHARGDTTPPKSGQYRVYRGGGWLYGAGDCRAAFRSRHDPSYRNDNLGCRPARSITE